MQKDSLPARGNLPVEREILRVLWNSDGEPLVRSEIHRRMEKAVQPSLGRVGQVLKVFLDEDFIEQIHERAQGARRAAFSKLSQKGLDLCRQLGFDQKQDAYFSIDREILEAQLTPERLSKRPDRPGNFIAFHSAREGKNRALVMAHTAHRLAVTRKKGIVLLLDFDFSSSNLKPYFASSGESSCGGLLRLILDFYRQPAYLRPTWLTEALRDELYILKPQGPHPPNLFYLSSGFSATQSQIRERATCLEYLRQEVGMAARPGTIQGRERNFLTTLREVASEHFTHILISPTPGLSESTWLTSHYLAETLVVCVDPDAENQQSHRNVIGDFLHQKTISPVLFLFFTQAPLRAEQRDIWIKQNILIDVDTGNNEVIHSYCTEQWIHDRRLVDNPQDWDLNPLFGTIASWSENPNLHFGSETRPVHINALARILDPETPSMERKIWIGILNSCRVSDLERSISWAKQQNFHHGFPQDIEKILKSIAQSYERRLRDALLEIIVHGGNS